MLDIARKRDQGEEMMLELANKKTKSMGTTSFSRVGETQSLATPSTIPSTSSHLFVPRLLPRGQPSILSMIKTRAKEKVEKSVARCFLWSDIPFNIGYKGPSYNDLRGPLLQGENTDCPQRLAELRESWEIIKCTVMSDYWTNEKGRSILNFLVNCSRGTMFIKFVDAYAYVKDAQLVCELLDGFI
jgi:hypothetical protein